MKPIEVSERAELQIREIDDWWIINRDKAPFLFEKELTAALDLISRHPNVGKRVQGALDEQVHRLPPKKTGHEIYYSDRGDHILVVAVWGGARRDLPSF